ncbi:MAG: hypothetical protein IAE85_03490 [Anaerolinea sp.]|nr:hypothetical protein [Anaerolinea sp.]
MKTSARWLFAAASLTLLLSIGPAFAQEAPDAGPCAAVGYDPACDVDHDGDIDIFDIQLTSGRWGQAGVWTSDNAHDHLGQTWTGVNNPLTIQGSFNAPGFAPLVLSNSFAGGDGLKIQSSAGDGIQVSSATFAGVYVESTNGVGFHVNSAGTYGVATSNTAYDGVRVRLAGQNGVSAESTSADHYGGLFYNSTAGGAGLYARSGDTLAPDIVLGGNNSGSDDGRLVSQPSYPGSDIMLQSNDEVWLYLDDDNDADAGNFVILNSANTNVFSVNESGNMVAAGTKSAVVETEQHGQRLLYAMESPQNWFEDFGGGQLAGGQATIAFEPIYAQTVNLAEPYRVFLTPLGDCPLYVAEKTPTSFTVRAMGGQTCDIAFDYRIVALRKGYEEVRLEAAEVIED